MAYVIRPSERASFKRCRRQWDLSAHTRQNLEAADPPPRELDLGEAIRDALAVYYFPGMWEWNRSIVLPLVRSAFESSIARQLGGRADARAQEERALGLALLERYFVWAPSVDRFWPVRIETDFAVHIPNPRTPGHDLVCDAGEVRYEGRVCMLVVDEADAYWIVDHRVARNGWTDVDQLLLDEPAVSACWAWELFYLGMRIAGTITNELRADMEEEIAEHGAERALETDLPRASGPGHRRMYAQPGTQPAPGVAQETDGPFRRTRIARSRAELDRAGELLAWEALDMVDPHVRIYPNPQPIHCRACAFRDPCLALSAGEDPRPLLDAKFRTRPPVQIEEGRLGGVTWGMNRGAMPMDSRARERQRLPQRKHEHRPGGDYDA
jgi:hypothetical protein